MRPYQRRRVIVWVLLVLGSGWLLSSASCSTSYPRVDLTPHLVAVLAERDYAVQILGDGDVAITEHWQMQIANGPFSALQFTIPLVHCSGITIGHISGAISQTAQSMTEHGYSAEEIRWLFPPIMNGMLTFDIPYTMHGALAMNDQHAWLDWHFLGNDDMTKLNNAQYSSTVTITFPTTFPKDAVQVTAVYPDQTPQIQISDDGTARISASQVPISFFLEVLAEFPRSAIDATVQSPSWQASILPATLPTSPDPVPPEVDTWTIWGLAALMLAFIIFCIILYRFRVAEIDQMSPDELKASLRFSWDRYQSWYVHESGESDACHKHITHHQHASTARIRHKRHSE